MRKKLRENSPTEIARRSFPQVLKIFKMSQIYIINNLFLNYTVNVKFTVNVN